ncbi:hypothetical protein [Fowlpox virus]|nr:hypothetical protein [Fowlpox virus]
MRKKRRRNKCCKIFIKALTYVSIKVYELYDNNKHIIYNCISNCRKVCSKNFSATGNTCIGRLVKYLTEEFIKRTARSMVKDPLGLGKRVLNKID